MSTDWLRDQISRDQLEVLAASAGEPRVSLYLPMDPTYPQTEQNRLRLRRAIDQAEAELQSRGSDPAAIRDVLAAAQDLEQDDAFRRMTGTHGLALLLAPGDPRGWRLPYTCPESVDVGPAFYLAPLTRLLHWHLDFFVLSLSAKTVRLCRSTRTAMQSVELPPHTPHSEQEYLAGTEVGRPIRFQNGVRVSPAAPQIPTIHGQTSYKDDAKLRLHEYVQVVARGASKGLQSSGLPLVLVAVKELHPIFREAFSGSELVEPGIEGSPDELSDPEIHQQAVRLLETVPTGAWRGIVERYERAARSPRGTIALDQIVPAAVEGRVDALIAAFGTRVWGTWDAKQRRVSFRDGSDPQRVDLVDMAVRETLVHGGDVCIVPPDQVPEQAVAAAAFRW